MPTVDVSKVIMVDMTGAFEKEVLPFRVRACVTGEL